MKNLTNRPTTGLRAVGVAGILSLAFSACGSDGADEDAAADTTEATDSAGVATTEAPAESADTTEAPADEPAPEATTSETTPDEGTAEAGGEAPADGSAPVDIVDFQYEPDPVEVAAGTEIVWTNQDGFAHTVTSDSDAIDFDSGNVTESGTFSMTFDEAGEYPYFCTIHNQMQGTIVVS